jgi:hypothetical protein
MTHVEKGATNSYALTVGVVNPSVVVVGQGRGECDVDVGAVCGEAEAVEESVVGGLVGAEEEAPLRTATGYHLVAAG